MGAPKYKEQSNDAKSSSGYTQKQLELDKQQVNMYIDALKKKINSEESAKKAALIIEELLKQKSKKKSTNKT